MNTYLSECAYVRYDLIMFPMNISASVKEADAAAQVASKNPMIGDYKRVADVFDWWMTPPQSQNMHVQAT